MEGVNTGPPIPFQKLCEVLVMGLTIDGAHHKQWCLEQALALIWNVEAAQIPEMVQAVYHVDYTPGIPG